MLLKDQKNMAMVSNSQSCSFIEVECSCAEVMHLGQHQGMLQVIACLGGRETACGMLMY